MQDAVPLEKTTPELEQFDEEFSKHYTSKMRRKVSPFSHLTLSLIHI